MTAIFLQARMDSSRLPSKALLPIGSKNVITLVMEALKNIPVDYYVLLTDAESAPYFSTWCKHCGFDVFIGSKDDVLDRYARAADVYQPETVIRATGDNPLVSAELAVSLLEEHQKKEADFSGYLGMPLGLGVEIVKTRCLLYADRHACAAYDREHVNPYIYNRPHLFNLLRPYVSEELYYPQARVTLDTEEDYQFISYVFSNLYHGRPIKASKLLEWLRNHYKVYHERGPIYSFSY